MGDWMKVNLVMRDNETGEIWEYPCDHQIAKSWAEVTNEYGRNEVLNIEDLK